MALPARGALLRNTRTGGEEEPCRLRTPFQRDRDRIVHSKAFRRLRNKTQVFIDPGGDHFRTRITHIVETMQVIPRALAARSA